MHKEMGADERERKFGWEGERTSELEREHAVGQFPRNDSVPFPPWAVRVRSVQTG